MVSMKLYSIYSDWRFYQLSIRRPAETIMLSNLPIQFVIMVDEQY